MSSILKPGEKEAKKADKLQQEQIATQKNKEELALAESKDEVARRKALSAGGGGRASLIKTSQAGTPAKTLGGA